VKSNVHHSRSRKPLQPVSGHCRWLVRPPSTRDSGMLEINGTPDDVLPLFDSETLVGYRLLKADGTTSDVGILESHGWTCDCPNSCFNSERPGGCKHRVALRAALKALGR
jgi:hypothetical protein